MATSSLLSLTSQYQLSSSLPRTNGSISLCISTANKDIDYTSASAALEAYIGVHQLGDSKKWEIRAKYDKDLEDLLIQKESKPPTPSRNKPSQADLRQYLEIRRIVDKSYEKLREQSSQFKSELDSATDQRSVIVDSTSILSNNTNLHSVLNPDYNANTTRNFDISQRRASLPSRKADGSTSGTSHHPENRTTYHTDLPKHLRKSWLESSSVVSCDERDLHDGYYSDSSIDIGNRDSFQSADTDRVLYGHRSGYSSSHSAPQSPQSTREKSRVSYGSHSITSSHLSRAYAGCDPDDTLTQLMSGRKQAPNVPSWVKQLEDDKHPQALEGITLTRSMTPGTCDPIPQCPSSPRKQLRFDLDVTQSSIRSNPIDENPIVRSLADKPPSGWAYSLPRTTGILKAKGPGAGRLSFTTEDISSSLLYSGKPVERESRRHHTRSFSANACLSSTPIKMIPGSGQIDGPHISGLSSVHSATSANTVSNAGDAERTYGVLSSTRKDDGPMKYLYDAVSDAESRSQALGVYGSLTNQIPKTDQAKSKLLKDTESRTPGYRLSEGDVTKTGSRTDVMRTEHKDYLRGLVQDIEDRSSSVVTGYTELHDIVHRGTGAYRDLMTPPGRGTTHAGLDVTPDTDIVLNGDRSWETAPARRPVATPDLISESGSSTEQKRFCPKKGGIVDKFLQECRVLQSESDVMLVSSPPSSPKKVKKTDLSGNIADQPGTMEALKNMLFTMQSMTNVDSILAETYASSKEQESDQKKKSKPEDILSPNTKTLVESATKQGGDSLERALVHLGRLKTMVKGSQE